MADINVERAGGNKTWLWAILAIIAVVALMLWLAAKSDETTDLAAGDEAAEVEEGTLDFVILNADPTPYVDSLVTVSGIQVSEVISANAVLAQADGGSPMVIAFGPSVTGIGAPRTGAEYVVTGRVGEVTPEILDEWTERGIIDEFARAQAETAPYYILAERVVEPGAVPAEEPVAQ